MSSRKLEHEPAGILAERQLADGRRKIKLNRRERELLRRNELIEGAVALFLDLDQGRTYQEIAEELEISVHALKDLTKTPEFDQAYTAMFVEIGHDPRYKAAMSHLGDMLPLAVKTHRDLLTRHDTPATVKMKAIELIYKLNGVTEPDSPASDRQELAKWLAGKEINLTQVNMNIPPEYMNNYEELFGEEVVDGEVSQPVEADELLPE